MDYVCHGFDPIIVQLDFTQRKSAANRWKTSIQLPFTVRASTNASFAAPHLNTFHTYQLELERIKCLARELCRFTAFTPILGPAASGHVIVCCLLPRVRFSGAEIVFAMFMVIMTAHVAAHANERKEVVRAATRPQSYMTPSS